jgi:hypothetical protein
MLSRTLISRALFLVCVIVLAQAVPVHATEISDVVISDVTTDGVSIGWKTDVKTDGSINFGIDPAGGIQRDPSLDSTHLITLTDLEPATTYYFRISSADSSGNRSTTAGLTFSTKNDQKAVANKAIKDIKKVTDPKELTRVVEEVQQQAQDVIRPPSIIGSPKVSTESDSATITWSSDRPSNSMVSFAADGEYQDGASDPYTGAQGDSSDSTTKHSVTLQGLQPSTLYHFQVSSSDSLSLTGVSEDDTFRTKSILPEVTALKISRIQEDSAVISWNTGTVKAKGRIEYLDTRSKVARSVGDPVYTTSHTVQVTGLTLGTRYRATVYATNEAGDEASSKQFEFITVRDVVPPLISKVTNESTLYPSEDTKVQTIITWQTDEPSSCTVSYTQGLVHDENTKADSLPTEKNPLTDHTEVIVGFSPATVYKFWMDCADEAGNTSKSDDFVLITPIKEKNIIDIILENFQGTFGWVNKIGK